VEIKLIYFDAVSVFAHSIGIVYCYARIIHYLYQQPAICNNIITPIVTFVYHAFWLWHGISNIITLLIIIIIIIKIQRLWACLEGISLLTSHNG
jgi:hypothetical protein